MLAGARRAAIIGGALVIAGLVLCGVYLVAVSRRCGEVRDAPRGSFDYHLCGVGRELIARVPIVSPAGEPLYSWRLADGTKPGHNQVRYESRDAPATVRAALAAFLHQAGFSERSTDGDYEWWTDHRTEVGLSIRVANAGTRIEVLRNTGND